jgi:hypothetical protein
MYCNLRSDCYRPGFSEPFIQTVCRLSPLLCMVPFKLSLNGTFLRMLLHTLCDSICLSNSFALYYLKFNCIAYKHLVRRCPLFVYIWSLFWSSGDWLSQNWQILLYLVLRLMTIIALERMLTNILVVSLLT